MSLPAPRFSAWWFTPPRFPCARIPRLSTQNAGKPKPPLQTFVTDESVFAETVPEGMTEAMAEMMGTLVIPGEIFGVCRAAVPEAAPQPRSANTSDAGESPRG